MSSPSFPTITEQVSTYLREELLRGRWSGEMPGQKQLAKLLGVSGQTVELALGLLEKDGILVGQGTGRRRKIVLPEGHAPPALRVAVLFYEKGDETHDMFIQLQIKLKAAGHTVVHAPKNLTDLGGNLRRLARMIKDTGADAWVVIAGSREVLQCFEQGQIPVFALYGGFDRMRIAGIAPNLVPAIVAATRRLIALGHQRIVILEITSTLSNPGPDGVAFLDELAAHGSAILVCPLIIPFHRFFLIDCDKNQLNCYHFEVAASFLGCYSPSFFSGIRKSENDWIRGARRFPSSKTNTILRERGS